MQRARNQVVQRGSMQLRGEKGKQPGSTKREQLERVKGEQLGSAKGKATVGVKRRELGNAKGEQSGSAKGKLLGPVGECKEEATIGFEGD